MAKLLRGIHKGKTVHVRQFANDWFSVELGPNRISLIVSPISIWLDADEVDRVIADKKNSGFLLDAFVLDRAKGTFKRKPSPRGSPK